MSVRHRKIQHERREKRNYKLIIGQVGEKHSDKDSYFAEV
jgi:hypothetical protein